MSDELKVNDEGRVTGHYAKLYSSQDENSLLHRLTDNERKNLKELTVAIQNLTNAITYLASVTDKKK